MFHPYLEDALPPGLANVECLFDLGALHEVRLFVGRHCRQGASLTETPAYTAAN
jgi:hypothetical protein